jgi:serine/threonine protein kinase
LIVTRWPVTGLASGVNEISGSPSGTKQIRHHWGEVIAPSTSTRGEPPMPQPVVQPLRRWDPERIGSYAIIGQLGAGAMGQVFLARSAGGRLVAVKTIRIELAEEPGFRARFAREVSAASRVSGVFTAAVIEANADADLPWVATAYVPAPSLSTLVRQAGPLPVPAVRWLAAGCAEALASIHAAGLLHRDVKPSNVLVAPDGPRVIDFGVARAAERVQLTATRGGGASGTPAYMAPEQARDATQASPASDIFSLGATLVYAATGHPPYQGDTVMDILVRLATEPPDLADVPAELTGLVAACLRRVPRDRPTSAAILTRLGPFAHPAGGGHDFLPGPALKVLAEYQRTPLPPATSARGGRSVATEDSVWREAVGSETAGSVAAGGPGSDTSGSQTALPGYHSVTSYQPDRATAPRRANGGPRARHGRAQPGAADRGQTEPGQAGRAGWRRRLLPWAAGAAALILIGAGTGLGLLLRGSGGSGGLGPAQPPPCLGQGNGPGICVSQPYGDNGTVFVVHGAGFGADVSVSVSVAGDKAAPARPVTDSGGNFNYALNQDRHFFSGPIPVGTYTVTAAAPGDPRLTATFRVFPAGHIPVQPRPSGAPTGQPPNGGPPGE